MFSNFNPRQTLPLTLITPNLIVQGTAVTHVRRLTDLLKDAEADLLVLDDAKFIEVGSHRIVGNAAVAQIPTTDLLMVHLTVATEGTEEGRVSKQPVRATLLAPPFTIDGMVQLSYEPELRVAVHGLTERWLIVSGARYWAYGVAEEPVSVDVLVVNHSRVHVVIPRGTEWSPDAGGSRAAHNPW
jgi:hypothetical protein